MSAKRPGNSYFIVFNAMEKKHIIKFLNGKKRGAYRLLVEMYPEVTSMPMTIALEIIREDLGRESGEMVDLNYNSLARAMARSRKKSKAKDDVGMRKRDFKDANELSDSLTAPGKFKIG
jgi:hypothetical protein